MWHTCHLFNIPGPSRQACCTVGVTLTPSLMFFIWLVVGYHLQLIWIHKTRGCRVVLKPEQQDCRRKPVAPSCQRLNCKVQTCVLQVKATLLQLHVDRNSQQPCSENRCSCSCCTVLQDGFCWSISPAKWLWLQKWAKVSLIVSNENWMALCSYNCPPSLITSCDCLQGWYWEYVLLPGQKDPSGWCLQWICS